MNREELKILLDDLYLDAESEELDFIVNEFNSIAASLDYFEAITTSDVKSADWPFEVTSTYLRDDVVDHTLENEDALQNAAKTQDGYVKYIKVV